MNHQWKNIEIPSYVKSIMNDDVDFAKQCTICELVIGVRNIFDEKPAINNYCFFINAIEILHDIYTLDKLNLNCNKVIIKNIIE